MLEARATSLTREGIAAQVVTTIMTVTAPLAIAATTTTGRAYPRTIQDGRHRDQDQTMQSDGDGTKRSRTL
jgi:hypothetical protein